LSNHQSVTAYPLFWPPHVPRTRTPQRSSFGSANWDRAIGELDAELRRLGARYRTLSTNQRLRLDGNPYAQQGRIDDAGVAVYFTLDGEQVCFPCDRWLTITENLRAITKHIEAMRGQQRWGVGTAKQAFAGYKALVASVQENWWDVLECRRDADVETINSQYRARARAAHPDSGGSDAAMARLNAARDQAMQERGRA
jgi:hypothetical protein